MDEVYYNSTSRGRIPVSDMCDEHVRRAFKKLLRDFYGTTDGALVDGPGFHNIYVRINGGMVRYQRVPDQGQGV
jgi:hypothetical protein